MPNKIKILMIITRLNIGGAASHIILLTERLKASGFETILASGVEAKDEGNMNDLANQRGIKPITISHLKREVSLYHDFLAVIQLYKLIRKYKPHIVHAHTSKAGTLGRIAAWLARTPVTVFTLHGSYFHSHFSFLKTKLFVCVDRMLASVTDRIIAVSRQERLDILAQKIGNEQKVINIPLGLELDSFFNCDQYKGILRAELGIASEKKLIGIVARLTPIKNHYLFLDSAKIVLQSYKNAVFLIVGDGELRQHLEEYAKSLGISDHVLFLGFRRDAPVIYADLDIVVLSSLNEGLPVTVIEGMASGKPIVATNVGGVAELLDDGKYGIIVPSSNPEELAKGMLEILNSPDKAKKMGELGRQSAMSKYSIDILTQNVINLYKQLLKEKDISF